MVGLVVISVATLLTLTICAMIVSVARAVALVGRMKMVAKCCICKAKIEGFGNNAEPIKTGICCDECNTIKVIPARLGLKQK
jgi:hypothetical protein